MDSNERYQEARELMGQGAYAEAVNLFEQNVRVQPHFKDLELLGECLMRLGKLVEAIVPLAAATTLNQGVRAPSLLAEIYFQMGEVHDANEMADLVLTRNPKNRKALEIKEQLA